MVSVASFRWELEGIWWPEAAAALCASASWWHLWRQHTTLLHDGVRPWCTFSTPAPAVPEVECETTQMINRAQVQGRVRSIASCTYLCSVLQFKLVKVSPGISKVWFNLYSSLEPLTSLAHLALNPEQPGKNNTCSHPLHSSWLTLKAYMWTWTDVQRIRLATTYFATARSTWGSCSHFFRASTLLVFLWGRDSRKMASAHRMPALGHSCIALAMLAEAMFFFPPLTSILTASNHSSGHWGFFRRAFSKTDLALVSCPAFSSKRERSSHRGIEFGFFLSCIKCMSIHCTYIPKSYRKTYPFVVDLPGSCNVVSLLFNLPPHHPQLKVSQLQHISHSPLFPRIHLGNICHIFLPWGIQGNYHIFFPPVPCGHNSVIQRSVVRIDTASTTVWYRDQWFVLTLRVCVG